MSYGHAAFGPSLAAPRVTLRRTPEAERFFTCASRYCKALSAVELDTTAPGPSRPLCEKHATPTTKSVRDGVYDVVIAGTVVGRVERRRAGFDPRWDAITTEPRRLSAFNIHSRRDAVARLMEELTA